VHRLKASGPKKSDSRRLIVIALILIVSAIGAALFFAAGNWMAIAKAKKLKNPVAPSAAALAEGKQIYRQHCENCHGESGDGRGEKAPELSTAPTDFTDSQKMDSVTDGEFYWQITKGRQPMPAFEDKLNDEQRWDSVDYIRTFERKPAAGSSATPASPQ
jgi:mono/diheme cytochrome c family protein